MRNLLLILCLTMMSTQVWAAGPGDSVFEYSSEEEFTEMYEDMEQRGYKVFTDYGKWIFVRSLAMQVCGNNSIKWEAAELPFLEDCLKAFHEQNSSLSSDTGENAVVSVEKFQRIAASGLVRIPVLEVVPVVAEQATTESQPAVEVPVTPAPVYEEYDDTELRQEIVDLSGLLTSMAEGWKKFVENQDLATAKTNKDIAGLKRKLDALPSSDQISKEVLVQVEGELKEVQTRLEALEKKPAPIIESSLMDEWGAQLFTVLTFVLILIGWWCRKDIRQLLREVGLLKQEVQEIKGRIDQFGPAFFEKFASLDVGGYMTWKVYGKEVGFDRVSDKEKKGRKIMRSLVTGVDDQTNEVDIDPEHSGALEKIFRTAEDHGRVRGLYSSQPLRSAA